MNIELCPDCGEELVEGEDGGEPYTCAYCDFNADTKTELDQARKLIAANIQIDELKALRYQESTRSGKQMAEQDTRLVAAGADAERLAAALMNTVNFFVGDTNVLGVLRQHEEAAKLYKVGLNANPA